VVVLLAGWYLVYQVVSAFLLTSFEVRSSSMVPTFAVGDRILATPLLYGPAVPYTEAELPRIADPAPGDVVIVRPPYLPRPSLFVRVLDPVVRFVTLQHVTIRQPLFDDGDSSRLLKRVIAGPGDTVRMDEHVAYVRSADGGGFVSELQLHAGDYAVEVNEPPSDYPEAYALSGHMNGRRLGPGEYFVLGDNRGASLDSRAWGVVGRGDIVAKVFLRYWPLSRFGVP
jgi:signal peptidase I